MAKRTGSYEPGRRAAAEMMLMALTAGLVKGIRRSGDDGADNLIQRECSVLGISAREGCTSEADGGGRGAGPSTWFCASALAERLSPARPSRGPTTCPLC